MKILVVASPWLGGSGTVGYTLSKALADAGQEVSFVSYQLPINSAQDEANWRFENVTPYNYPLFPFPMYELALAEKIAEVVKRRKIEIIHAHYGIVFGYAALIAKMALASQGITVKLVTTFHGSDLLGFDFQNPGKEVPKNLNYWLANSSDAITVASKNLGGWVKRLHNITAVSIIPNYIDTKTWSPTKTKRKEEDKPTIIHISNFRKVKQPLEVVKIFRDLQKEVDCKLIMVGTGPEIEAVKNYADKNKLAVLFVGVKKEVELIKYYKQASLLLMPSLYENFSLVALEAQAMGLPVVASKVGGFGEVIKSQKTGFLIKPTDHTGFVKAVKKLLSDKKLRKQMSNGAIINAKQFELEKILPKYIELYERLLKDSALPFKPYKLLDIFPLGQKGVVQY